MVDEFDIPVPIDRARDILRQKFRANAHIKDTRVIDMLVVKVKCYEECIISYQYEFQRKRTIK